jgi:hypothetical protein
MYLGFLEKWLSVPDVCHIQMTWSHDGEQWFRPSNRKAFLGPEFPWNRAWNTCASTAPILEGSQLWIYFGGRSGAHAMEAPQPYGVIGLASITVDRFVAMRADFKEGVLVTKPMTWPGGDLVLNSTNTRYPEGHPSHGGGDVAVEVRDENNRPLAQYCGEQRARYNVASPARWKSELAAVRWPGDRSLDSLKGRRLRLVFLLKDARLYSFRARAASGL